MFRECANACRKHPVGSLSSHPRSPTNVAPLWAGPLGVVFSYRASPASRKNGEENAWEPAMRYVKGHGLHARNRIVEEASYGLRQAGVNGISVSDLMKLAGLTHGGFYAYFESREALIIEA